jgi:hypothetical protein
MGVVGRLKSTGILQSIQFDELNYSTVGVSSDGVFHSTLFDENTSSTLTSNIPMRIGINSSCIVYDYFDEITADFSNVFDNLLLLSSSLNSLTNISSTNLGAVQSTIQTANPSFNVFAVAIDAANAELLQGTAAAGGKTTLSAGRFVYNSSDSNILSTGKPIVYMSGGANNSLPIIDNKRWMAMAVYDGTTNGYRGILLWVFTDDSITTGNVVTAGGKTITTTKSIFQPALAAGNFARIYQVVIGPSGNVLASNTSGNGGWNFSDTQAPNATTGYFSTSSFSSDDGAFAFVLGGKMNANAGGTYKITNGYGFGNYNGTDGASSDLYWAGSLVSGTTYVGFVFTGDA